MMRLAPLNKIGNKIGGLFALMLTLLFLAGPVMAPAPAYGQASTSALGDKAQTDFWRSIRQGEKGSVSIPDKKSGQLIQSEGDNWRTLRNGPLSVYGAQALIGMVMLLAIFFLFRGRVKIDHGWSGWTVKRFNGLERFGHWLMAGSFIILGLSGLNMLYGRYLLLPLIGPNGFATLTAWGKVAHNYVAFAFMLSLILVFVMWVVHNIPGKYDLNWVLKGGGIVGKSHPPAKKFNFGQKMIFWLVILCGALISLSGISLLFPFQTTMFADIFAIINVFGFSLPTELAGVQEMQLAQLWHSIISLALICVIVAHIYIGTMGMEGAFDAMGSGRVDLNWAKEHHSLWVEELDEKGELDPQRDVGGRVMDGEPAE